MAPRQVFCHICGNRITDTGDDEKDWLQEAIAMTTRHQTENGFEDDNYFRSPASSCYGFDLGIDPPDEAARVVKRYRASYSYDAGPHFNLLDSDNRVEICSIGNNNDSGPLYLAVHDNCLQLSDHFIQKVSTDPPAGSITSLLKLWEVLYRRVKAFDGTYAQEPHQFFAADGYNARESPGDMEHSEEFAVYEIIKANPLEIPDLTDSILKNLHPVEQHEDDSARSHDQSQDQWCDALVQSAGLPWLYDLNTAIIRSKQRSGQWDWKALVVKLRNPGIHLPGDPSLQLPPSLRNRRRIWRILELARVNDIAKIRIEARMTGRYAWMYGGVTNPPSAHPSYGYETLPLRTQPLPPRSASGFPPPSGSLLRPQSATNNPPTSYYQEAMKNRPPGFVGPPPSHAEYLKNRPLGFPKTPLFHRKITKLPDLVSPGLPVSLSIASEANLEPSESSTRGTNGPLLEGTEQQSPPQEEPE
ncbi:hypothetical protein D6C84_00199 [Aureobasidium pullulans]|uniref:Uncharacterized protein n=1 Tax=Aureobasidium pullulans TaxID=5580 RepID=A0A4S9YB42_AURPU|nr:hypothetical protein D6C84_00199 [Aureobasidium pullulans]